MAIKYLRTSTIKNKTAFVRADVNVPIEDGKVGDDFRIQSILPIIRHLQKNKCKIVLCGHLGRPEGKWVDEFTLAPVAKRLAELLDMPYRATDRVVANVAPHVILFTGDVSKEATSQTVADISSDNIILLENIRFYEGEEENSAFFAKRLASLADVMVNEAFAVDHRKAASTVGITKYLPAYAGLLLEQEIQGLGRIVDRPKSPFVVMMGGAKISDKAKTLQNLGKKADVILVGGGLGNLFFAARGYEIGKSKAESEAVKLAWQMDKNFKGKLQLPVDVVVANSDMDKSSIHVCAPHEVKKSERILDAGPKTILAFARELKKAQTIIWNGPLGFFEQPPFHHSTMALARIVGSRGKGKAFTVVGGGETVDAVRKAHQADYIDHLSTGGGAMLEYLAGAKLPGIEALK